VSDQLTYVLITPSALHKARTGGILARLLSRSGLNLVAGRLFDPSQELAEGLASTFEESPAKEQLTANYLRHQLSKTDHHALILLLSGADAISKVNEIVGTDKTMHGRGETLRDTYGDLIFRGEEVIYFEPGVIAPRDKQEATAGLSLLAQFSDSDAGILDASFEFPEDAALEKTLVLIKPDNFDFPNTRPGGVIDLLARTGLALVGFKVQQMSVAQAKTFYGPVLEVLEAKLPDGRIHWESIIEFMSGARPSEAPEESHELPGTQRCIALIYQGRDAVRKIRETLGPTDPSKAPHGTIRKEFGRDIMVNGAHASDSSESFSREIEIININENNFKSAIAIHFSH